MGLAGFICPDGQRVEKEDCLVSCRLGRRCLTLPTLMACGQDREWTGKPSTTQLLSGLRLAWLKIKRDYFIEPQGRAFALLGVRHHAKLEEFAKVAQLVTEHKLDGDITGIVDLLEPETDDGGAYILSDYKTWGSYSLVKAREGDFGDALMQLNHYRVKLERDEALAEMLGQPLKISRLQLQVTIRDGGTYIAKNRGVEEKIVLLDVPKLDDDEVLNFFSGRAADLLAYINKDEMPPVCTIPENWNWKRCKGFCDVAEHCPEGRKINKLGAIE